MYSTLWWNACCGIYVGTTTLHYTYVYIHTTWLRYLFSMCNIHTYTFLFSVFYLHMHDDGLWYNSFVFRRKRMVTNNSYLHYQYNMSRLFFVFNYIFSINLCLIILFWLKKNINRTTVVEVIYKQKSIDFSKKDQLNLNEFSFYTFLNIHSENWLR